MYGVNIYEGVKIKAIDTAQKTIVYINTKNNTIQQNSYDHLILASLIHPSIPWCVEGVDYSTPSPNALYGQIQQSCNKIILLQYCDHQTMQYILCNHKNIAIIGSSIQSILIAQILVQYNKNVHFFEKEFCILGNHFDSEYTTFFQDYHSDASINFHTNTRIVKIQNSESNVTIIYQQQLFDKIHINEQAFDVLIIAPNLQQINNKTITNLFSKELELINTNQLIELQQSKDIHIINDVIHLQDKQFNLISRHAGYNQLIQLFAQLTNTQLGEFTNTTYYRQLNYDKFNVQAVGLPLECLKRGTKHVKQLIYSDYLYQQYVNNMQIKAVQTKEIREEYALRVSQVQELVDKTIDSSYMDFAYDDDNVAGCMLYVDDNGMLLGGQSMGVFDCTYNTDIMSLAISSENSVQDILSMDFGGLDGVSKPWNVLQMTAASLYMKLCDFEGVDASEIP